MVRELLTDLFVVAAILASGAALLWLPWMLR